ncbi:MAG TPA: hypothetical protein VHT03_05125 [Rhizomicrobium sp.]|jgi:hypothetical protein|nr:hypothetical protein [Rhizomicrobium sp.]
MTDATLALPVSAPALKRQADAARIHSRAGHEAAILLAVSALFIALTGVLLWPWLVHLHSALAGPPEDNMNDLWNTWYTSVASVPGHFFHTRLLRFPEGTPLTYQSFNYPQIFVVTALSRFLGTDLPTLVALQNLTLLASFPLAGLGGFYLVRHLTDSAVAGLAGGFVFAFSPFHVAQASHHIGVGAIEFLPFFALAYLLALDKRSASWLCAAVICFALSALSCWYYLFYGAYFLSFQVLYQRFRTGAWPRGWPLLAPALCVALTIAILLPFLVPMIIAGGQSLYAEGGNTFSADLLAYVAFPPQHFLSFISRGLYARFTGNPWETTVYLGLINLALLLWHWSRTGFARESLNAYCALGIVVFALLAGGEALHVAGAVTIIHLPDAVLDKLPFFADVRTPARAAVFVYLFMSVGVGAAVAALWRQSNPAAKWFVAAVSVLLILDFFPCRLQTTPIGLSPGLHLLRADKDPDFGVLNLPFGYAEEDSYMLEQISHRRPMVDGMTAREQSVSLLNRLSFHDLGKQRNQLVQAHVKYILIHHRSTGYYKWNAILAPLPEFLRTYTPVYTDTRLTILRVY